MASVVSAAAARAAGATTASAASRVHAASKERRKRCIMDEILAGESSVAECQGQTMDAPEESMIRPGVVDLVVIRMEQSAAPGGERQCLLGVQVDMILVGG